MQGTWHARAQALEQNMARLRDERAELERQLQETQLGVWRVAAGDERHV
jgi:hypothetical protein